MKPLLVYIQPRTAAGAARTDIRLASGGAGSAGGLGSYVWEAAVVQRPRLSLDLLSPTLDGKVSLGKGDVVINLGRIRQYDYPRALYWMGAPITIYDVTNLNLTTAPTEFTGYVKSLSLDLDTDHLTLNFEVSAQALDKPVLYNEFTGGGGILGDPDLRGTVQPAGFGTVKNCEPVWFDLTRNIGMIDGYGNTTSIDALFEGGNDFGAKVADYANYATLAARIDDKTVPPGRWATCVAYGLIGLGAPPVKPITADCVFGYNRTGALIQRLMTAHAGVSSGLIDTAAFTSLDSLVNRPVHHWLSTQRSVQDLIEALAAACNSTPLILFQGKYSITRAFGGSSIGSINRRGGGSPRITKWRALDPDPPAWRMLARTARPGVVLDIDQILYADTIGVPSVYSGGVTYRQGNRVYDALGNQFLYIGTTPSAGNLLPAPGASNTYWQFLIPAPPPGTAFYADGTSIDTLRPASPFATRNDDGGNMLSSPTAPSGWALNNAAFVQTISQFAFPSVALQHQYDSVTWSKPFPVVIGETLYFTHSAIADTYVPSATDVTAGFSPYAADGTQLAPINIPSAMITSARATAGKSRQTGSLVIPATAVPLGGGAARPIAYGAFYTIREGSSVVSGTYYVGEPIVSRQKPGDVSASIAPAAITATPPIARANDGTVKAGELPRDFVFKMIVGGIDVTTSASWSAAIKTGSATFTPTGGAPNNTGVINVTAASDGAVITVTAVYGQSTVTAQLSLPSTIDPPATTGGGGSGSSGASSTTAISNTTSASYGSANTPVLTVKTGSGGSLSLIFPGKFKRTSNGSSNAYGKWQWRPVGGTFADVGSEIMSDDSAVKAGAPEPENTQGDIAVNQTKSGLAANTNYEVQLLLRNSAAVTCTWTGTAQGTGS